MDLTAIAAQINTAADETTARTVLAPLTAAQLRAVAAALPVHHRAGDSKRAITDLIVQHRVTRRLSSAAISRPAPARPEPDDRPARAGETCTCGRRAVVVYRTERFGDVGHCGT